MTLDLFQKRESEWDNNWLVQDFIEGNEVSLDVYVDRFGNSSSIARDRIRVSEGEVLETETRDLDSYEKKIVDALISEFELRGPINVQLIGDEKLVLEINPRFSGGSTASISAGWNAPNWLVSEYLFGREARLDANYRHVHVIRSRRDHLRRVE
jgi:carbamoyl-phosphate synthase large subunit